MKIAMSAPANAPCKSRLNASAASPTHGVMSSTFLSTLTSQLPWGILCSETAERLASAAKSLHVAQTPEESDDHNQNDRHRSKISGGLEERTEQFHGGHLDVTLTV